MSLLFTSKLNPQFPPLRSHPRGTLSYLIELVKSVSMLSASFEHHYLIHYKINTITVRAAESLLAYENTIPGSSLDSFDVCLSDLNGLNR